MKYRFTKEKLEQVVNESLSIAEVCRKLGIRPSGGNYKTINSKLIEWKISKSHFTGAGWNVGLKFNPHPPRSLDQILVENSTFMSTFKLKLRLFKEGLKEKRCEVCNRIKWNHKPIPLELDHINGINTDNRIENLRIICPNCHAQTSTHRGKNKLSALAERREVEYRKFREALTDKADGNPEPSPYGEGAETLHDTPNGNYGEEKVQTTNER